MKAKYLAALAALGVLVSSFGLSELIAAGQADLPVSTVPPPPKNTATRPSTPPEAVIRDAKLSAWRPIFAGVELCQAATQTPRPIQVRAVRVDLHDPGVELLITPSNGDEPKDVAARSTTEFLTEFKCQVAINAGYFDPWAKAKGDPLDVRGLAMSRGDLYSEPTGWRFDTLLIGKRPEPGVQKGGPSRAASDDGRQGPHVWIVDAPVSDSEIRKAYQGVAGEDSLLREGRYGFEFDERSITRLLHPRSAVGITRDGRYLLLVTIDGRQPGYSEGTTKAETAEWMRKLGAWDALNLDGGGSTAMAIQGPDGAAVLLNRPSGPPPGAQRRVGNHIGVFAKALR